MANEQIKNFSQLLALHASGATNDLYTEAMQNMVAELSNRVIDRGGKQRGTISLTVEVTLEQGVVRIDINHPKAKTPEPAGTSDIMWATPENNLQQSNPKQRDMFKDVSNNAETRTA